MQSLPIVSNHDRERIAIGDLRIVVRMGSDLDGQRSLYIGLEDNGAELDQNEILALIPYLERFGNTGTLIEPKPVIKKKEPKRKTFNPKKPDKKFIKMILWQALGGFGNPFAPTDIYKEAWCLSEVKLEQWNIILKYMLDEKLIEESGEPDFYKATQKGNGVINGESF